MVVKIAKDTLHDEIKSIKESKLDEKLPKDLARAYNRDDSYRRRSDRNGDSVDYENADYEEITPEKAIELRRQGAVGDIRAIINGDLVTFRAYDGYCNRNVEVWGNKAYTTKTGKTINNTRDMPFSHVMKIADKIYYTNELRTHISDDKLKRRDKTDDYYFTGGADPDNYWSSSHYGDRVRVSGATDTGKHLTGYGRKGREYKGYLDDAKEYKERLRRLQAQYDAGDLSKNEYEARKTSLQRNYDLAMQSAYRTKPDRNTNSPLSVVYAQRNLNKYKALKATVNKTLSAIENQDKKLKDLKANASNSDKYSYYRDRIAKLKAEMQSIQKQIEYCEQEMSADSVNKDTQEAEIEFNRLSDRYSNAVAELNALMKRN